MTVTGDIASGASTITNAVGSGHLSDLQPGQPLSGTGIPENTRLASVDDTTLNLSKNTTANATGESFQFDEGLDLAFDLFVVFPNGWEVDADIDMLFDQTEKEFVLNEIFLKWQATNQESRVPIGDTGLFLNEIDAKLLNVNTPDVVVSGDLTVEYGDEVLFLGKKATLFSATGGFTVDKDHLELDATVYWGSYTSTGGKPTGVIGDATGKLLLDWNDRVYLLDVKASMYKGVFTFEAEIEFSASSGVFLFAEADVNVPHGIPFIGGKKLGSLDFLFKYEQPDKGDDGQAQGFVAAWTEINLVFKKVDAGIQYDFENGNVKFIGSGAVKADLSSQSQDTSKPYTWQQQFTVPSGGATQASLTADWTRAFPEGAKLTKDSVTVVGEGWQTVNESAFSSSNGLTLLPVNNGQLIRQVGLVGSATNELTPLPVADNKTYTLQFTVTSDTAPRKDTASVISITSVENPDTSLSTLIKLSALPGDLRVGDVITVSASSVSGYNTNHTVIEITADGELVTDQTWSADDTSGNATIKNWYVPQFHSTFHIPSTQFSSADPIIFDPDTGKVDFNVAIAGLQSLQTNTEIDVYVDVYNSELQQQLFKGTPVVTGVKLNSTSGSSLTPVNLSASTVIDLTRLDPAFQYYVYGLVNDGTNPAALSPASKPFGVDAAVEGNVLSVLPGQATGEGLSGWTVFVDENGNGTLEAGEIRTTTIGNGDYSFLPTQIESLSVVSITEDSQSGNARVGLARSSVHGLRVGSMLTLSGTTGYDGTFAITEVVSDTSVVIDKQFVGESSSGTATSSTDFPTSPVELVLIRLSDNYLFATPSDGKSGFTYDRSNIQQAIFLLNEKSTIKGRLVNASGSPLAGWVIYFDQNNNGIWDDGEEFRSTNSDGEYYFGSPDPNSYTVALAISDGAASTIKFENVVGTQVLDVSNSGTQHSGTLMNGATPGTADSFGIADYPGADADNQVIRLDGNRQFVQFDPTRDFVPGTGSFSFATWFRGDDTSTLQAIAGSAGAALPSDGWALLLSYNGQSQKPYLYMAQDGDASKTMEVAADMMLESKTWYHIAFTYDGTNDDNAVSVYINGVPVKTTLINNTLDATPIIGNQDQVFFNLGGQGSSTSLPNSVNTVTGYMDDMAVWGTAISQQQVQAHYLARRCRPMRRRHPPIHPLIRSRSTIAVRMYTPATILPSVVRQRSADR